jgi:hypothetical protein
MRQHAAGKPFFAAVREAVPAGDCAAQSLPLYKICSAHFVTSPTQALIECERRPFLPVTLEATASLRFLSERFGVEVNEDRLSYDQNVSAFFRSLLLFFRFFAFSSYKEPSVAYLLSHDSVVPIVEPYH